MATTQPASDNEPVVKKINRREFLNYLLGASVGLLGIESCGMLTAYALPTRNDGPDRGFYRLEVSSLPAKGSFPKGFATSYKAFWLSNTTEGLLSFKEQCIKDGQRYKWVPTNRRFECPLCGSKFQPDGTYIEGGRVRDLDRYLIEVHTPHGTLTTPTSGEPVFLDGAEYIVINTNKVIQHYPCGAKQYDGYNVSVSPCPD